MDTSFDSVLLGGDSEWESFMRLFVFASASILDLCLISILKMNLQYYDISVSGPIMAKDSYLKRISRWMVNHEEEI